MKEKYHLLVEMPWPLLIYLDTRMMECALTCPNHQWVDILEVVERDWPQWGMS